MNKYRFILRKVQEASIELEFDENKTIGEAADKLAEFSEEELNFGTPEYHLVAVSKEDKKISKIIWRSEKT